MHSGHRHSNALLRETLRPGSAVLGIAILLLFLIFLLLFLFVTAQSAEGQNYKVIYSFTGAEDGSFPNGVTLDSAGNLYGTTGRGGYRGGDCSSDGCGTAFRLSYTNGAWVFTPLHAFSGPDGANPSAPVTLGPDGTLYGTTYLGGGADCPLGPQGNCGVVFRLRPSGNAICNRAACPWVEEVLHRFTGAPADGRSTRAPVVFDSAGNLYGTAETGGAGPCNPTGYGSVGCGVVYSMSRGQGGWTESVLYSFQGGGTHDGEEPLASVTLDPYGNLYGTTNLGGNGFPGCGTVFALTRSGSAWTETVLHVIDCATEGSGFFAGLTLDGQGNLLGAASHGGPRGGGTVFRVLPGYPDWIFETIYAFAGEIGSSGPAQTLAMDPAGNLYGTSLNGGIACDDYGRGCGFVFRLTYSPAGWILTHLYDFTGGDDGKSPRGVVLDRYGNLWGAAQGGLYGQGLIFEITP